MVILAVHDPPAQPPSTGAIDLDIQQRVVNTERHNYNESGPNSPFPIRVSIGRD